MKKKKVELTYTFVNPNTAKQVEEQLKKVITEKLLNDQRRKPL